MKINDTVLGTKYAADSHLPNLTSPELRALVVLRDLCDDPVRPN